MSVGTALPGAVPAGSRTVSARAPSVPQVVSGSPAAPAVSSVSDATSATSVPAWTSTETSAFAPGAAPPAAIRVSVPSPPPAATFTSAAVTPAGRQLAWTTSAPVAPVAVTVNGTVRLSPWWIQLLVVPSDSSALPLPIGASPGGTPPSAVVVGTEPQPTRRTRDDQAKKRIGRHGYA